MDDEEVRRIRAAYARAWEAEFAFADEIADMNREYVLRLAAKSKDPEERNLLLRLAELGLTGGRDDWRVDKARLEGRLAALVEELERTGGS